MEMIRCTYCGRRGDGRLLELELRGVLFDYCDAACATAHRMAVELTGLLCSDCDAHAEGDTGACAEHLLPVELESADDAEHSWRRAG